jgi:hypothetical protein
MTNEQQLVEDIKKYWATKSPEPFNDKWKDIFIRSINNIMEKKISETKTKE